MASKIRATIDDLNRIPDKAEIVNGEIIIMSPTGIDPKYAADAVVVSLWGYSKKTKLGRAVGDNAAFRVHLPRRESFSPDAAYYTGQASGMNFFEGAPAFAVEVRSAGDYGPKAEKEIAAKHADYFAAGTLVVWGVDLLSEDVVKVYRASDPQHPAVYRKGDIAEAEPAVPGWAMPVADLFAS